MIPDEVEPGRRNQSRELRQELERFEHNMRRAVAPAVPELIQKPAIGQDRQALRGYCRARNISAEIFQLAAGPGGNADIRVQAETVD